MSGGLFPCEIPSSICGLREAEVGGPQSAEGLKRTKRLSERECPLSDWLQEKQRCLDVLWFSSSVFPGILTDTESQLGTSTLRKGI